MAGPNSKKSAVVIIRALQDSDKADVARIWADGLEQSRSAVPWFLGSWFMKGMHDMRDLSLSDAGDIGPNGTNVLDTYDGKEDRCMFVATTGEDPPVVVGCCAVKKGMDDKKEEPNSEIGSIWKMSVDEKYRGYGIGTKLMSACEGWSRAHGCTRMGLWTINPVAASFYINRMGYKKTTEEFYIVNNWFAKLVVPPVIKYEKPL
jgi:ribosomal protein S18 acetylase RimI-like enzyme